MSTTGRTRFCDCGHYCLNTKCTTSDSGKTVRRCWCAECKERRAEISANAYRIVEGTINFSGSEARR